MRAWIGRVVALALIFSSLHVRAAVENEGSSTATREFIMSCTYGVLAGTLVGAASLAFVSKPSENLNRVARGASIGLYAGILLGLYVVYVVPSMEDVPSDEDPLARLDRIPVLISPTMNEYDLPDGAKVDWKILRF